jgi:hypothetical protein
LKGAAAMRRVFLGCVSLAFAWILPACAADDAADAKAIIAKAIKAAGLAKGTDKPFAETWKDKGTINIMGQKLDYVATWIFQSPDKYRLELKAEVMGQTIDVIQATDGTKAIEGVLGLQKDLEDEKLEHAKIEAYQFWIMSLNPLLKDKGFKLKTLGAKKIGDHETVGVQVDRQGKPDVKLYFSKDTGLLAKLDIKIKNEFDDWKEALDENFFEDYKDQDGRKGFTKLRVRRNGDLILEANLSDWRRIAPVDLKKFQEP